MAPSGTDLELPDALREAVDAYDVWLAKQPLADRSRDASRSQVRAFVAWLAGRDDPVAPLTDPARRDWAARD